VWSLCLWWGGTGSGKKIKRMQKRLFEGNVEQGEDRNKREGFVIKDREKKQKYSAEEIKNKVISGDAFKVLKKMSE